MVRKVLGMLDAVLATRTFLVGERVTLADITVVCNLLLLYKHVRLGMSSVWMSVTNDFFSWKVLEPRVRAPFVNVNRWFVTCVNQPEFRAVLGAVELCTKMAQFDGEWWM